MTEYITCAPHEFIANYNYDHGLGPFFAIDRAVKAGGGSKKARFEFDSGQYTVTLYYQDSNIIHPGETTPAGTLFEIDEIREFRLSVEAVEPDHKSGQKGFNAHVRPRWGRMRVQNEYGDERQLHVPFEEGLNVKIQGSNIEFKNYKPLFQQAMQAVSVNSLYFEEPHESSQVQQAERYVRVHENESGPVHARDGPLARLGHLLEGDRDGRRKIEQSDVTEDGERVPGYRHQVGIDEKRVREVFPDHDLPKRWKHYRARESHNLDKSDPLRHPKVGAIYYGSLWRDRHRKHGVSPAELDELTHELEEAVLSVLHDAGLDVTSSRSFVADDYFTATTTERDRQVVELPLEDISTNQESVVIKNVADGLSPVEWEALETLVSDGGEIQPADIAEENDRNLDVVYRALDRIDGMLDREYGSVQLRSTYVGELVHDAVRQARERTREAVEASAQAMEAAERGLDERTSALVSWASKYCENFRESDDGLGIRFGKIEAECVQDAEREIRRRLREGKRLWDAARSDDIPWRLGNWSAQVEVPRHPELKKIDGGTVTVAMGGDLWDIAGR